MLKTHSVLILLVSCCGLACTAGSSDTPEHRLSGEYAVTTSFVSIDGPGISPADQQAARSRFPSVTDERQCFDKPLPRVGNEGPMRGCTFREVLSQPDTLRFEAVCEATGEVQAMAIEGTQSAGDYDYTVTITDKRGVVGVSREHGRRLGDCPS
jgi:hypothetical protein